MSQPRNGSNGHKSGKIKAFGLRKPAQVRMVSVPPEWMKIMNGLDSSVLEGILLPRKPYYVLFPCRSRLQIIFDEGLQSLALSLVPTDHAGEGLGSVSLNGDGSEQVSESGLDSLVHDDATESPCVVFADQFSKGLPSYIFISLAMLAIAIEIQEDEWDILNHPVASEINDFLRDTKVQTYPSDEIMKLFSSSGKPRIIKAKGYNPDHSEGLSISLQGFQTMLISIGATPEGVSEMSHLDLSSLPSILVNALMGIIDAIILDQQLMHASIGAHLKVEGGPKPSKV